MTMIVSLFCHDPVATMRYFQQLLGWTELERVRSPIYRCLVHESATLGFHAPEAYDLLGLDRYRPAPGNAPVTAYPTMEVDEPAQVDALADQAVALGGRLIKAPFATYYGQWQTVLASPEGHVFRLACTTLPEGVTAPPLDL